MLQFTLLINYQLSLKTINFYSDYI